MKVPFLDLKSQYESIKSEVNEAIQQVVESCAFAGGPFVEAFEKSFSAFCQCKHCIGVGSGTEALWTALLAIGVGPGDEVITVPNTFIATAEAISFCGATPVFVDIDEDIYTMDPEKLKAFVDGHCTLNKSTQQLVNKSTMRTVKAVIPVHIFGQMTDMDPIMDIARENGLAVIEDACQAHGALYKGQPAGSIGDAGCFSFYPGKNLGAYGEAGAIVTNNSDLAEKIAKFHDHGQARKYYHDIIGWNARMDGLQGAVLNVKLKHLPSWTESRRKNARLYNELLAGVDGILEPKEAAYGKHVYHLYAVRAQNRDQLIANLAKEDIYCGIHYPVPVHLQQAYQELNIENGRCPIAETCAEEYISLPMFPELNEAQINFVVEQIEKICKID